MITLYITYSDLGSIHFGDRALMTSLLIPDIHFRTVIVRFK